jgi:hypothetical protein
MWRTLETHVTDTHTHNFPNSGAGIEHGRQKGVITTTEKGVSVNCAKYRLDFIEFEVLHWAGTRAFERDGQNALTQFESVRMLGSTVPKEGMNRGQAHISRSWDIVPFDFKIVQEIQHLLGPEIFEIQIDYGPLSLCGKET